MPLKNNHAHHETIIKNADICVRCGMCLPHCPTYRITQNESESPRGRIAIAKALAQNKAPLSEKLFEHLDHCLHCQACEAMCPVNVPYSHLMEATEVVLQQQKPHKIASLLKFLIDHPKQSQWLNWFAWLLQKTGLTWLATQTKFTSLLGLTSYLQYLPPIERSPTFKKYYPTPVKKRGDIALFLGCINRFCDTNTLTHSIQILNAIGYGVIIPPEQTCCGAMDTHMGNEDRFEKLKTINQEAFISSKAEAIMTIASGCGATLTKHAPLPVFELCDFLGQQDLSPYITQTIDKKILVHTPCTLKNVLHPQHSIKKILEQLGFKYVTDLKYTSCCGAAGLHMWNYPEKAKQLAEPIITEVLNLQPDYFVTANIGCMLHLQAELKEKRQNIQITHPINLIFQEIFAKNPKKCEKI